MACSRFEYVKRFEHDPPLLPCAWAVIRLDGRNFSAFSKRHAFVKPNDARALHLCNAAATAVLDAFSDHLLCAFGQSDEFSFVLRRESPLFGRRSAKILSTVVSLFSAAYVRFWDSYMGDTVLEDVPSFDGRVVVYPTTKHVRDYLAWRQADVHVNNLFNTAFWALVHKARNTTQQAEAALKGTLAKHKHELLFSRFAINYNNEPPIFRKGSFIVKRAILDSPPAPDHHPAKRLRPAPQPAATHPSDAQPLHPRFVVLHQDIIADSFWDQNPRLLAPSDLQPPRVPKLT